MTTTAAPHAAYPDPAGGRRNPDGGGNWRDPGSHQHYEQPTLEELAHGNLYANQLRRLNRSPARRLPQPHPLRWGTALTICINESSEPLGRCKPSFYSSRRWTTKSACSRRKRDQVKEARPQTSRCEFMTG